MSEIPENRVQELENILHDIKGLLEGYNDSFTSNTSAFENAFWVMLHTRVSEALEQSAGVDPLREAALEYLREYINFPINRFAGDDPNSIMTKLSFGDHPDWTVIPPRLDANEAVYRVRHVTGAEYAFNYYEIEGSAST